MNDFFNNYLKTLNKNKALYNTNEDFNISLVTNSFFENKKTIFLLLPNLNQASIYYEKLQTVLKDSVLFYPIDSYLTIFSAITNGDFLYERLNTIKCLIENKKPYVVVGTYNSFLKLQMPFEVFKKNYITISKNNSYNIEKLKNTLIASGYKNNYIIEKRGEFSQRGSVFDIFPFSEENPIRIDFFDDKVEDIKYFDINSQLSKNKIDHVNIFQAAELVYTPEEKEVYLNRLNSFIENKSLSEKEKKKFQKDIKNLENNKALESLLIYYGILFNKKTCLLDFEINKDIFLINFNEYNQILELENGEKIFLKNDLEGEVLSGLKIKKNLSYINKFSCFKLFSYKNDTNPNLNLKLAEIPDFNGILEDFMLFLKNNKKISSILLNLNSEKYLNLTKEFLSKNQSFFENINVGFSTKNSFFSFLDLDSYTLFINEEKLFKKEETTKTNYRSLVSQSSKIYKPEDIKRGDYVVHYEKGIGKYLGLVSLDTTGLQKDYLLILYKNNEKLYVPVEQIDLILKYHKDPASHITLSKLGTKTWDKVKTKTKQKIKELYDELLTIYNFRNKTKGYSFYKNEELEKQLEDTFQYEETLDQKKAILEILKDMEKETPMERLLCGDVGFGKTEIAIRSSFRAVLNNKQVAVLVPTTILAKQHYETFKNRLNPFGVNVEMLTRFQSKKETTNIINNLKSGQIDIIVGTHKILSPEIKYKNIGLYIIDEEQRFGVKAKETIKKAHLQIDSLYMSATPIPRTLKMGLSKIKSLSLVETPPKDRFPVQTYILERNYLVLKNAILKEIARKGQIFYLVSKIKDIPKVEAKLKELIPDIKIASINGQMDKLKIELTLNDYINKKTNLLISTTLIENGIDIPNANTLIVHDSNQFGLSQLYQIKGRVGRTNKIAFAYFCIDSFNAITEDAKKRLNSLKEFSQLGSGYQIAMQDLLIRGSGDLLGKEQSGFIDSVGLLLYLRLVDENINNKEELKTSKNESFISNHIKEEYIKDEQVRIEIHKKINSINSKKDLTEVEKELTDRFGEIYSNLKLYLQESLYKKIAKSLNIIKTSPRKKGVKIEIDLSDSTLQVANIFNKEIASNLKLDFSFKDNLLIADISFTKDNRNWLYILNDLLIKRK